MERTRDSERYLTPFILWNAKLTDFVAFQTAVALAVYDAKHRIKSKDPDEPAIPEVKEDHLRQVVLMSSAFRKYMTAANEGMSDEAIAFKEGLREDRTSALPDK